MTTKKSQVATKPAPAAQTIGTYLIDRLYGLGLRHVFGIPGDYVLQFYKMLEESKLEIVGTTREDAAGFAADAYARVRGLGCVCVRYCVGGFNVCNPIAGAFAEKSPVVLISGSPGMGERETNPLLHHRVREFTTQREVFEKLTIASAELSDPLTAFREVDRVLDAALRFKRPVYLELPRDQVDQRPVHDHVPQHQKPKSNRDALAEALEESVRLLGKSKRPVILAGVEIHRFALQDELIKLAEGAGLPITTTLLGKSVVSEKHPLYVGVYEGAMGREEVRQFVEDSDCVLLLGAFMTDINLGVYTANLDPARCIYCTSEQLRIRHHHYHDVLLEDFLRGLIKADLRLPQRALPARADRDGEHFQLKPSEPVTIRRLFQRLDGFIEDNMVVIADIGDALFGASDLEIHRRTDFLSPAYYTSMGFAVPAAIGAQFANRECRPLVIVGDGAVQMTGMELSTAVRHGFNPIVLVLNNRGYGTERLLQEGKFNDIHEWRYHQLPEVLGGGRGFEVQTEGELDQALKAAHAHRDSFSLLNIHIGEHDRSPALDRLTKRLAKKI